MSDQTEDFTLVLDPVVDEALQSVSTVILSSEPQIYQSTDPLDAPDFDPVVFINEQVSFMLTLDCNSYSFQMKKL